MANITIDSNNPLLPIIFKAIDQETQIDVMLNNSASVTLAPTTDNQKIYNITITPQGKNVEDCLTGLKSQLLYSCASSIATFSIPGGCVLLIRFRISSYFPCMIFKTPTVKI